ncbi:MAG: methyltransferase domain-containing protein, partial [Rhodospirillales bacterium]|nr:methyltransferase domain-containing protein [Acetobacter sp.]
MNTPSPLPAVERGVRCWCGNANLEDFSPDYQRCTECQTLVVRTMPGEEISEVRDDEHDFYGKSYYQHHVQEENGLPDLQTRARADLPERCLYWLKTLLRYVSGPGARTLELGSGHGGFVAMQRWAGLDATGLELSPWLVRQSREWFGVPVLEGRLEDQELAPASWDAVILMDVLEHLPDPLRTIRAAVALLRSPQSFLLIQTPCYPAGRSYEELCAQEHPFLQMLKPLEHLYLFSEQAVIRLCTELGVGEVRFEPAIFGHYDQYAVASAEPLRERDDTERTRMLMAASPPARWTLALLDLAVERDVALDTRTQAEMDSTARLRQVEELTALLSTSEADRAARGHQVSELTSLLSTGEADRAARGRQIEELTALLATSETDRAARLRQVEELTSLLTVSQTDSAARLRQV